MGEGVQIPGTMRYAGTVPESTQLPANKLQNYMGFRVGLTVSRGAAPRVLPALV